MGPGKPGIPTGYKYGPDFGQRVSDGLTGWNGDVLQRFWRKVDTGDGCWLWTGSVDGSGYGMFRPFGSKRSAWRAHRMAWHLCRGSIPDGVCVLHQCDTPSCVRPDHLFLGSRDDNMKDRNHKNRQAKGEGHGNRILTEDEVLRARERFYSGETISSIAASYGMSFSGMRAALLNINWRHL